MAPPATYFHPLANDERGLGFELDASAKRWRLQRTTGSRGRQEPLYGADHRPLEIPISATVEDLTSALLAANYPEAGRYRLVPVDAQGAQAADQCGYVVFRSDDEEDEPSPRRNAGAFVPSPPGPSSVAFDVAAVTQAITEGIRATLEPTMVTLRAVLTKLVDSNVTTTDGLLRSRVPQVFEMADDEEEVPEVAAQSPADQLAQLTTMAAQFMQMLDAFKRSSPTADATPPRNASVDPPFGFGGSNGEHP